jgi:hypothetical protein
MDTGCEREWRIGRTKLEKWEEKRVNIAGDVCEVRRNRG